MNGELWFTLSLVHVMLQRLRSDIIKLHDHVLVLAVLCATVTSFDCHRND